MSGYKYIETSVASYIAGRHRHVAEIGAGNNLHAANLLFRAGIEVIVTDIIKPQGIITVPYYEDDVSNPDLSLYFGIECIYSIRPVEEMIPPMIKLAKKVNASLYVYHLGFEGYGPQNPVHGCAVPLHLYYSKLKSVD